MIQATSQIGNKYGFLTIISEPIRRFPSSKSRQKETYVLAKCDCGLEKELSLSKIKRGHTKSCGCFGNLIRIESITKHGMARTRIYRIWRSMKRRCNDPNNDNYKYYGARGIQVCQEWLNSFESFMDWAIDNGYNDTLTIERKENDKNYTPKNCGWATRLEQSRNRRNGVLNIAMAEQIRTDYASGNFTKTQLANKWGIQRKLVYYVLEGGWRVSN